MYARFEADPASVDPEWREFFRSLKDQPADVAKNAKGPSWEKPHWPPTPSDDLTSALDGNWAQVEKAVGNKLAAKAQATGVALSSDDVQQQTRDSVRALMLIRAYRMRGHFHANLDPLGIEGQTGTLEAGKMADVVVWNGNPFSSYALAEQVFIDGRRLYDRNAPATTPRSDFQLGQEAR